MTIDDSSFSPNAGLEYAVQLLHQVPLEAEALPETLPEVGLGEMETLDDLAPHVLGHAAFLDAPEVLAHMDPHSLDYLGHGSLECAAKSESLAPIDLSFCHGSRETGDRLVMSFFWHGWGASVWRIDSGKPNGALGGTG